MPQDIKVNLGTHLLEEGKNVAINDPLSKKIGAKFDEGLPDTIILHYTAGPSVESAINTLVHSDTKASAHLVVGRDGSVTQLVPFDTIAWHAGRSSFGGRSGFNKYSIGIEIVNAGHLQKERDQYKAWFGKTYPQDQVLEASHQNHSSPRFWHTYTKEQIDCVLNLCTQLKEAYSIKEILGHDEIAPSRKTDPGPAFPLESVRSQVLGREEDSGDGIASEGVVIATKLNIRHGPNSNADLAGPPLPGGTKVKILNEKEGWYEVEVTKRGWVSKNFIES
ncbi:MAG: N-acetylmuramoyl-L-alanine amidase [Nitrospinota bacterium]